MGRAGRDRGAFRGLVRRRKSKLDGKLLAIAASPQPTKTKALTVNQAQAIAAEQASNREALLAKHRQEWRILKTKHKRTLKTFEATCKNEQNRSIVVDACAYCGDSLEGIVEPFMIPKDDFGVLPSPMCDTTCSGCFTTRKCASCK